jgi:Acetyltransferases
MNWMSRSTEYPVSRGNDMIRFASIEDIDEVAAIYDRIHQKEREGLMRIGWMPGVYPVRATALDALRRNDLFVCELGGRIVASAIINKTQVPVYVKGTWAFPAQDGEVMVLHTLTVDPDCTRRGIGRSFVDFYESYALEEGCTVVRLDTNEVNGVARKMYPSLGYREAGIVPCVFNGIPDVNLVLFEKKLG